MVVQSLTLNRMVYFEESAVPPPTLLSPVLSVGLPEVVVVLGAAAIAMVAVWSSSSSSIACNGS